jgi:hypothetical protein
MSLTPGVNHPAPKFLSAEKPRFQGEVSPAMSRGAGGPGGVLGGLAQVMVSLKPPEMVEKFFLNTAKEGPMALVPLESSVIVGRSERAYRRDGLLELQERVTEEVAAAIVWLFGVGYLQKQFEKVSNAVNQGKNKHLSTNIAWNQPWAKTTHVDLSPQEMFAKNKKEINVLLGLKSARWLFSVGTALVAVGYLIPKGNQLKTNFILKHLERRKRSAEGSNVQFGDPRHPEQFNGAQPSNAAQSTIPQRLSRYFAPLLPFSVGNAPQNPSSQPASIQAQNQTQTRSQAVNPFQSNHFPILGQHNLEQPQPNPTSPGVRFSGGIPGLSLVQGLGHMVEQTPYGSILVVDAGIAGGRGYVASKRSPYETAEVLFRDIGSLYFYILCAPQLMKLMTSGLDPLFKSSSHLQPKVADLLHEQIKQEVKDGQSLSHILHGAGDHLMAPEGTLRANIRLADGEALDRLLQKEIAVYMGGQGLSVGVQKTVDSHIVPLKIAASNAVLPKKIAPGDIQHLLNSIADGQGAFGNLGNTERKNLSLAVKQAFRHTVGLKFSIENQADIKALPEFKALLTKLEKEQPKEAEALLSRIQRMAILDGMNQTHSMMRRSINVIRGQSVDTTLLQRGEALADWIDRALHHQQTLDQYLPEQLDHLAERLHQLKLTGNDHQQVIRALNGSNLDSLQDVQKALSLATPRQLNALQQTLKEIGEHGIRVQELLPFKTKVSQIQTIKIKIKGMVPFIKTQAVKMHELKESLADLNRMLTGKDQSSALSALKSSVTDFMDELAQKATGAEKLLLQEYRGQVHAIIQQGEGRLFSLATRHEDAALGQKLREMLRGGIMNDSRLLSKALETVGQLETDTRKAPDTGNANKMRKGIEEYCDALVKRFNQPGMRRLIGNDLQKGLQSFYDLNRNLHFGARGLSLATTMACIGWLVPIMQTKITKHLTGQDKNPGIASAKKIVDNDSPPLTPAKPIAPLAAPFATIPGRPNWNASPVAYPHLIQPPAQTAFH